MAVFIVGMHLCEYTHCYGKHELVSLVGTRKNSFL